MQSYKNYTWDTHLVLQLMCTSFCSDNEWSTQRHLMHFLPWFSLYSFIDKVRVRSHVFEGWFNIKFCFILFCIEILNTPNRWKMRVLCMANFIRNKWHITVFTEMLHCNIISTNLKNNIFFPKKYARNNLGSFFLATRYFTKIRKDT
jgi:hypothetical protein